MSASDRIYTAFENSEIFYNRLLADISLNGVARTIKRENRNPFSLLL